MVVVILKNGTQIKTPLRYWGEKLVLCSFYLCTQPLSLYKEEEKRAEDESSRLVHLQRGLYVRSNGRQAEQSLLQALVIDPREDPSHNSAIDECPNAAEESSGNRRAVANVHGTHERDHAVPVGTAYHGAEREKDDADCPRSSEGNGEGFGIEGCHGERGKRIVKNGRRGYATFFFRIVPMILSTPSRTESG